MIFLPGLSNKINTGESGAIGNFSGTACPDSGLVVFAVLL